jgi:hypothetical protein
VKSQAYRLSLRLGGDALGEVLQREARFPHGGTSTQLSDPDYLKSRASMPYCFILRCRVL